MHKPIRVGFAVATLLLAACSSESRDSTYGYPVRDLRQKAMRMARNNGDAHPESIRVVRTRFLRANDLITGDTVYEPDRAAWVLEVTGDFTCNACSYPRGATPPTGTVMYAIFNVDGTPGGASSLGSRTRALQKLGKVVDITRD